jgi:hypothetical protein
MSTGQRLLLRGYGPLVGFIVFFALMAALAPTVDQTGELAAIGDGGLDQEQGTQATPGGNGQEAGATPQAGEDGGPDGPTIEDADDSDDPGAAGDTGNGGDNGEGSGAQAEEGSGAEGASQASASGVQSCEDRELQVPGDPYSPPCLAFDGDNGGETSRGVSDDTILLAVRTPDEPGFGDTLANLAEADISDTPNDVRRTVDGLVDYFNERFEFYGRQLEPVFYEGQGSPTDELLGGGQEAAQQDALTVAEDIGAFAELNGASEPFGDALSRQGVVNFGVPYLSRGWMTERRPYSWSMDTDCDLVAEAIADYVVTRVIDKPAEHAGGPLQGEQRRVAYVAPDNPWYQGCVRKALELTQDAGHDAQFYSYQLDLNTMSNQAANLVARLQSDGITTIQCSCDPVLPVFLTARAAEQSYQPEWVVSGVGFTTQDYVGQVFNQDQWSRAYGISYDAEAQPQQASLGYNAYRQVRDDEPAFAVQSIYDSLYLLSIGIQGAGPNLTPETFERGLFDYPGGAGPSGTWGFSEGNYTPTQDFREVYWDPEAVSPFNSQPGTYAQPDDERYRPGELPPGPPRVP